MPTSFLQTRYHYDSYSDLYRLVQVAGYPLLFLDEADWTDASQCYICPCWNGEWTGVPDSHAARLIYWNIERPAPWEQLGPQGSHVPRGANEVWTSDRGISAATGAKYVFMGSHPDFALVDWRDKEWDVITLCAFFGRRTGAMSRLSEDFKLADRRGDEWGGLWDAERHRRLCASKVLVTIHQDDWLWSEPPRLMLAGTYALPVISEQVEDAGYWADIMQQVPCDTPNLLDSVRKLLSDEVLMCRLGAAGHHLVMDEHPFKQEVEAAL